ncbi:hypothetical protein [Hydrogenobacter thermophilus]|uniref:hypothetical protein n=1 Tax=Hydrogenobacter thermophilus TaxID=940 RepID=UPI0030FB6D9D
MRRHKLDRYPEAKREVVREYSRGKTLRELEQEINVKFPDLQVSKSSLHRYIQTIKPFLQLRDAGLLTSEDIDLITNSQDLMVVAKALLMQVLAEWHEKGEIDINKVNAMLDFTMGLERISRTSAYVQKTKEDIAVRTGKIINKLITILYKHLADKPELIKQITKELEHELQA